MPAALLIVSLFGLLLYLMTRCCDRKPRTAHSITSLKVTLSVVTVLCCAAIGLGLYGNDDLHNGLLDVLGAGRKVDQIISSVKNQVNFSFCFFFLLKTLANFFLFFMTSPSLSDEQPGNDPVHENPTPTDRVGGHFRFADSQSDRPEDAHPVLERGAGQRDHR